MRDRRNVLLALTAGVDDPLSDFGEFRLSLLGYPPQHLESGDVIDTVSHHEDAFGLADTVSGQQRGLQLLSLALGQNRGGSVRGENGPGGLCVGVPDIGPVTKPFSAPRLRSAVYRLNDRPLNTPSSTAAGAKWGQRDSLRRSSLRT